MVSDRPCRRTWAVGYVGVWDYGPAERMEQGWAVWRTAAGVKPGPRRPSPETDCLDGWNRALIAALVVTVIELTAMASAAWVRP